MKKCIVNPNGSTEIISYGKRHVPGDEIANLGEEEKIRLLKEGLIVEVEDEVVSSSATDVDMTTPVAFAPEADVSGLSAEPILEVVKKPVPKTGKKE